MGLRAETVLLLPEPVDPSSRLAAGAAPLQAGKRAQNQHARGRPPGCGGWAAHVPIRKGLDLPVHSH